MSLSNFILPLTNIPQQFTINLANVDYTMTVKWNDMGQTWMMDIADSSQNPIAYGIPFVTGADLLDGLAYLGINGSFIVYTNGDVNAVPTLDNLGTECNLYFQTSVVNNGG